jgi:hypothetical protein
LENYTISLIFWILKEVITMSYFSKFFGNNTQPIQTPNNTLSQVPKVDSTVFINDLPYEILLKIFEKFKLKDVLSARLVCHRWKVLASDPKIIYSQYFKEINSIERLQFASPSFSAWTPMPRHWGLCTQEDVLRFSSINRDIIAFYPRFFRQSSQFFSFNSSTPFSDRNIFLSQYGNTYFLTPQGETPIKLDLPSNLQPHASHKLVAINIEDPTKNCEFSLLGDLPLSPENLSRCQIDYCFPLSENNIVIITKGGEISFWDLSNKLPNCYKKLQTKPHQQVYKIGGILILHNQIVNLDTPSLIEHEFKFEHEKIKTFGSTLCAHNPSEEKPEIRYFVAANNQGLLEKKWNLSLDKFFFSDFFLTDFYISDLNEQYVLLVCWYNSQEIKLLILNTQGELVHSISEKVDIDSFSWEMHPILAHLSDNILIYKNPQGHTINFWHIPTRKCIQKFEWTKSIYDLPLYFKDAFIQDICFSDSKLTLLLSTEHTDSSNKPAKFRLIQFDAQNEPQKGLGKAINSIISTVKQVYYAFPGKKI